MDLLTHIYWSPKTIIANCNNCSLFFDFCLDENQGWCKDLKKRILTGFLNKTMSRCMISMVSTKSKGRARNYGSIGSETKISSIRFNVYFLRSIHMSGYRTRKVS